MRAFIETGGPSMVAKVEWGPLERATNAVGEKVISRNFDLRSHDGYVSGRIVVQETSEAAAAAECESRLVLLLKDAIKHLGR
jgi:hypothetical protein